MRLMKRKQSVLAVALLALCLSIAFGASGEELRGYSKADGGYQYVLLGEYPYEADGTPAPVMWRILSVEDQRAILLSEMILDCKQVTFVEDAKDRENHNYPDLTDFRDSDLSQWLNSDMLTALMGENTLKNAIVETDFGMLWLLSYDQMADTKWGFDKSVWKHNMKSRRAYATPYAREGGILVDRSLDTSPWWSGTLRNKTGKKGWIAGVDGHISVGFFGRMNVGVRPAMTLDLTRIEITSGSGTKDDPFVLSYRASSAFIAAFPRLAEASASDVLTSNPSDSSNGSSSESGNEQEMVLSFIGDLSIGDATQSRGSPASLTNVIKEQGYAWPFSLIADYLKNDDYTFANLECVFTEREALKAKNILYCLIGQPDFVQVLTEGGVDVLNTVNNHSYNFSEKGYQDTLNVLDAAGLNHFGTNKPGSGSPQETDILGVAEVKGVKIGMVGLSYPDEKRDYKKLEARIQKLKDEMGCQLVVVSLHWGREDHPQYLYNWQMSLARKLIDAGADVIWGHHPHVLHPVMFYKGKPIMFSTGNFIFGTIGQMKTDDTGIFQLHYDVSGDTPILTEMSVVPCKTGKRGDYRPYELVDDQQKSVCWNYMIYKKKVAKMDNLPASFAETGRVLVNPDGTLADAE